MKCANRDFRDLLAGSCCFPQLWRLSSPIVAVIFSSCSRLLFETLNLIGISSVIPPQGYKMAVGFEIIHIFVSRVLQEDSYFKDRV